MVSIGVPEKGRKLIEHLEFKNGEKYLYVDPDNAMYDALTLNSGIERLVRMDTSFSFLDRFTKKDGMKDLGEVLSKWNNAFFIPPKRDQAFNQGGTFVFNGERAVFAHYDPSTAAHATLDQVMKVVGTELSKTDAQTPVVGNR
uniref:Uncharacterized protein n=1 Tax=Amphora coffeiformis TaxID=265554 RepID=A0A7S3L3Z1_9STRA|mmetsp:Transcript_11024/g.22562  ORF Transcript_11024/g.22562 Transcript_11024/m.22562 type:complete len:143 (-) Transcript_11024:248-676(-)|eukprot:scaffold5317_cov160-Amphora_coffeaeformis.AAC.7